MYRLGLIMVPLGALLLTACVGASVAEKHKAAAGRLNVSMSDLRNDPWQYHLKPIRVRGTFDECQHEIHGFCNFCEDPPLISREEDDFRCMGVQFGEEVILKPGGSRQHLYAMAREADDLAGQNYRFATVTLDAVYDATCSGIPAPDSDGSRDVLICLGDWQLREVRVIDIHVRRAVTEGHMSAVNDGLLIAPGREETKALHAAFRTALSRTVVDDIKNADFVFLDEPDPNFELKEKYGIEAIGGACLCRLPDCSGVKWPKRLGDARLDSPANPYKCWPAEKTGGVWRFTIE